MAGWPEAERIEASRLRLEPLTAGDADEMAEVLDDVSLHEYTGARPETLSSSAHATPGRPPGARPRLPSDSQPIPTVPLGRGAILTVTPNHQRESPMSSLRSKLVTAAAVGAAAVSGAAIAGAATSGTSTSSSSTATPTASTNNAPPARQFDPSKGGHTANGKTEKLLTGDVASKVRAAALAKVSGTVERVETNVDSSAPYEAHIRKADGTEVEVQVNSDYSVAAVNQMGQHP